MSTSRIALTCTARSHEHRTVKITRWAREDDAEGIDGTWVETHNAGSRAGFEESEAFRLRTRNGGGSLLLVGDIASGSPEWPSLGQVSRRDMRTRWRLSCHLCGAVVVVQDEQMQDVLSRCAAAGMTAMDLEALGRVLS